MFERYVVKPLERVKIRTKLVGVFVFGMVVIGGALAYLLATQVEVGRYFRAEVAEQVAVQSAVEALNNDFKTQVQEWKNLLLRGEAPTNYWQRVVTRQEEIQQRSQDLARQLSQLGLDEQAAVIETFREDHRTLFAGYRQGREGLNRGQSLTQVDSGVRGLDRAPAKALSELAGALEQHRVAEMEALMARATDTLVRGALLVGGLMLLFVWGGRTLALRAVVRPTETLSAFFAQLAQGNFATRLTIDRADEMGDLANHARQLQGQLRTLLQAVGESGRSVGQATEELDRSSAQGTERALQQRDQTHQVASAMSQMTASVIEVASHAQHAAEQVGNTDRRSSEGQAILTRTISDLEQLDRTLSDAGEAVARLAGESQEIGGILDVIRNIADQTNLLALNAAIEAARAGEQGRGFAVVADEVRSLSLRTQDATGEIQQMIDQLQSGAQEAVSAMTAGQSGSQRGLTQTREAGETLAQISQELSALNDMNAQIATAAEEQSKVSEEINHSVGRIRALGDQVAEDAEAGRQIAGELRGGAQRLDDQLARFTLA
ncbi:methyl-accepting chemotaxis protein [Ferrimonas balearica]|uniref:methyl-accepting chemotaxis protein n=1 Tax=Ferrimonas balearica TaxID=44012 RepID=UPI001C995AD9|nr:methyl-accepting chemotaxis protein [Ferrimonas balearica]MBY5993517.1 methyl-accepting chemotaxis protein [Ferrimonas balearica]